MKKKRSKKGSKRVSDELRPEYRFDYRAAKPNRFARFFANKRRAIVLDPDVGRVFTTSKKVNETLRGLIGGKA